MRVASVDIGTNTVEILIADKNESDLRPIEKKIEITRLGGDFSYKDKTLNQDSIRRSIKVLRKYSELILKHNVENLRVVATSIVRSSSNADFFAEKVFSETGLQVEVISGIDEAKLSATGAIKSVSFESQYFVVVDIGGGSTELSLLKNNEFIEFFSIDLGVVKLTENFITHDIPTNANLIKIKNHILNELKSIQDQILSIVDIENLLIISNAGTPSTVASSIKGLARFNPKDVNESIITEVELMEFFNKIATLKPEYRIKMFPAIENGREDLIICGVLILDEILMMLKAKEFMVSEGGLLEGILYEMH